MLDSLTTWLLGRLLSPTGHQVEWLFLRLLGLIYFIAFTSLGLQVVGLIGSRGILPVSEHLHALYGRHGPRAYLLAPTLFWLNASDSALRLTCQVGALLALLLTLGLAPRLLAVLLYLLYLSLVHAGQVFLAYQWDALLLEAGFLAIFLDGSSLSLWLGRWLLFRLMFLSGAVKLLSGDPTWRSLTALSFHYQTQPLPNPVAWYLHQAPLWFHRLSTLFVLIVELAVPFLAFGPPSARLVAAGAFVLLQALIFLTGNYNFFNLLTIALCLFLLDDAILPDLTPAWLRGLIPPVAQPTGRARLPTLIAAVFILPTSLALTAATLGLPLPAPAQRALSAVGPWRAVNTYGLFAVMTTVRPEIVVEGSLDGETWLAYEFRYKPGEVRRPPPFVAPHQPRLDWQMWFAALRPAFATPWFPRFLVRLLEGSPEVLSLLAKNPFPQGPPRYVRARLYDYRFTDFATRRATGAWWERELLGEYFPPIALPPK